MVIEEKKLETPSRKEKKKEEKKKREKELDDLVALIETPTKISKDTSVKGSQKINIKDKIKIDKFINRADVEDLETFSKMIQRLTLEEEKTIPSSQK